MSLLHEMGMGLQLQTASVQDEEAQKLLATVKRTIGCSVRSSNSENTSSFPRENDAFSVGRGSAWMENPTEAFDSKPLNYQVVFVQPRSRPYVADQTTAATDTKEANSSTSFMAVQIEEILSTILPGKVLSKALADLLMVMEDEDEDEDEDFVAPKPFVVTQAFDVLVDAAMLLGSDFPLPKWVADDEGGIRAYWDKPTRRVHLIIHGDKEGHSFIYHAEGKNYGIEKKVTGRNLANYLGRFAEA